MSFIERILERAKQDKKRVAISECTNESMMRACVRASKDGLADVVFVGNQAEIEMFAQKCGLALDGIEIADIDDAAYVENVVERYIQLPNIIMKRNSLMRQMSDPLYMAFAMEAVGDVDCTFSGLDTSTFDFLMAANGVIGLADNCNTASTLMLLEFDDFEGEKRIIGLSDGAICVKPTAEQLASIAITCADTYETLLGEKARVALLSHSTCGSAEGPGVEKIQHAVALAQAQRPDLYIDGEFQADAAVLKRVGEKKVKRASEVAGRANLLIFPDAAACNIVTKLLQAFAQPHTYGPIFQGFRLPVLDCSRGDTEERLYNDVAICSVSAAYLAKK